MNTAYMPEIYMSLALGTYGVGYIYLKDVITIKVSILDMCIDIYRVTALYVCVCVDIENKCGI